jgi:hypothetical protein
VKASRSLVSPRREPASPFEIFGTIDNLHTGLTDRASYSGSNPYPAGQIATVSSGKRTGPAESAFVNSTFDQVPTVRRNQFFGPRQVDTDAVFEKDQTITERFKLIFRAESYNVFNHPQFLQPASGILGNANFGISTGTQMQNDGTTTARQIQASLSWPSKQNSCERAARQSCDVTLTRRFTRCEGLSLGPRSPQLGPVDRPR